MPDLDDLLGSGVGRVAAHGVQPPDFAEVAARGRQRRTRHRAVLASAAAVVVLAGTAAALDVGRLSTADPDPAVPTPTSTPSSPQSPTPDAGPTPEEIVDADGAAVSQVAAFPDDPDVRAVVWRQCATPRCDDDQVAIAVTGDGFRTRALVGVRRDGGFPWLTPAGQDAFVVSYDERHPYLLRTDGSHVAIAEPAAIAPLAPDEALTRWRGYGDDFIGVDPATGAAHRLPVPEGTVQLVDDGPGLTGVTRTGSGRSALVWSDDGGAGWQTHPLEAGDTSLFQPVASAVPGLRAIIEGSDGATLFPFEAVQRGYPGEPWARFGQDDDPRGYIGASAVLPDGRLLVDVIAWSDARAGKVGSRPRGPYVTDGDHWSDIARLVPGPTSGLDADEQRRITDAELDVVGVAVAAGAATVYVSGLGDDREVYAVTDSGTTWERMSVR